MLQLPKALILQTTAEVLKDVRTRANLRHAEDETYGVPSTALDVAALAEVRDLARTLGHGRLQRAADAVLAARQGQVSLPVPTLEAFKEMLLAFLQHDLRDGWVYVEGQDGRLYPELVKDVVFDPGHQSRGADKPKVVLRTCFRGVGHNSQGRVATGVHDKHYDFYPSDVTRKRVAQVLENSGLYKETEALRTAHDAMIARHDKFTRHAFARQFRLSGRAQYIEDDNWRRRGTEFHQRRVIHDLDVLDFRDLCAHVPSCLFAGAADGEIPEQPVVRVFDLETHEFLWAHSEALTPHEYDKGLRDKLVLPASHRDLLDILTSDVEAFTTDLIEGKSAGNAILCKGVPGVGKTLTAEVYAEQIERPLYKIHAGNLGVTADVIETSLREAFQRAKRWNATLLLDEADVFVSPRGDDVQQNAIVAVFLRTLEYFDGLFFMTTNRDEIDDAIESRMAAIIRYELPEPALLARIWQVMSLQFDAPLAETLIDRLVHAFPRLSPRDIKNLFRLALRVAKSKDAALDFDHFRRIAMFRGAAARTDASGPLPAAA
ncbi:AAA family ATPase [Cupriavidus sp. TMH.W2]|uniref:AAA family ATPase n=1 Tax=Cupriavidus sp. TMH.W2 TaxID=3434465 RepID=UPI003D786020